MSEKSAYFVFQNKNLVLVKAVAKAVLESPLFDIRSGQVDIVDCSSTREPIYQLQVNAITKADRSRLAFFTAGVRSGWNRYANATRQEAANVG